MPVSTAPRMLQILFLSVSVLIPLSTSTMADDIVLVWNQNSEPNVAGYKVYYGIASRNYGPPIDVKNTTTCTISGLGPETYYFAATAYTDSGFESSYSKEVSYSTLPFALIAVGGGFSTALTLSNPGAETLEGSLLLIDSSGSPLTADIVELDTGPQTSPGGILARVSGSSVGFTVAPNSTRAFSVAPLTPGDIITTGWAKVIYSDGPMEGTATLQLVEDGITKSIMGIRAGLIAANASFPVGNDGAPSQYVGLSVVNPNDQDINIRIIAFDADGIMLDSIRPQELNPLRSHQQVAKYLHEYLQARPFFKGSVALVSQGGQKFVVTAALQDRGLYTIIPVVPFFP